MGEKRLKISLTFVVELQVGVSSNHSRQKTGLGLVRLEIGWHFQDRNNAEGLRTLRKASWTPRDE